METDRENAHRNSWKLIEELTDETVLGLQGRSAKAPREASRAILMRGDGLYAVMYVKEFHLYSLPGGGLEEDESEVDALKREVWEETGCTCDFIRPLGVVSENRCHADYTTLSYYFAVRTKTNEGHTHLTEEELAHGTCLKWCTLSEMLHLIQDCKHDMNQRRFIQARDLAALREYCRGLDG